MNDRELLELAAKAAGFGAPGSGAVCWTESEYPHRSGLHGALWNYVGHMDTAELWNPLNDDGDALRLAVKLRMEILVEEIRISVYSELSVEKWEMYPADSLATTRRLIVETAAEIGKAM